MSIIKKERETFAANINGVDLTVDLNLNSGVTSVTGNIHLNLTKNSDGKWVDSNPDQLPDLKKMIIEEIDKLDSEVRS